MNFYDNARHFRSLQIRWTWPSLDRLIIRTLMDGRLQCNVSLQLALVEVLEHSTAAPRAGLADLAKCGARFLHVLKTNEIIDDGCNAI